MTGHALSPEAQLDLEEIWDESEAKWGAEQAERYVREVWDAIVHVAEEPRRGRACDEIRAGYFKHGVGKHVLFFKLSKNGIDVIRILHGSMDFARHL